MQTVLIVTSTIFALISPITYVVSILRGNTKPHRTTRFVLGFVQILNFVSLLAAHGSFATNVLAGIFAVQGVVIGMLSIRRGMGGSSVFDWVCLCIALAGVVAWKLSGNALAGVWFSVLADAAACAPAVVKTWRHPHTETHWLYSTSLVATVCSLAASSFGPTAIFQLYIIVIDLVLIFAIYHRQFLALTQRNEDSSWRF